MLDTDWKILVSTRQVRLAWRLVEVTGGIGEVCRPLRSVAAYMFTPGTSSQKASDSDATTSMSMWPKATLTCEHWLSRSNAARCSRRSRRRREQDEPAPTLMDAT